GTCPNGDKGCLPRDNRFCEICSCAYRKGERFCFTCKDFPCEITEKGPVSYGYCSYIAGKT
ncbi:MAG: DUF3795 domain-containing protein, partial [Bacteroidetes bacterium]|nr:DUF3795 domain-containing protein [Bacteroidota bacterium]